MRSPNPSAPQVFNHSLDWRFLLPLADLQKGLVLFEENADFTRALEQVGILPEQRLSFLDVRALKDKQFPVLALPFGLPTGKTMEDGVAFYSSLRRTLEDNGYLLVGFHNAWNWRAGSLTHYRTFTPRRVTSDLAAAGFKSVRMFGAMPNLNIPEYIFDLDPRAIQFALQNRFRRKPALLRVLGVLAGTIGMHRISNFLPGYFAVATA